jgi:hypothetical protein
MRALLRNPLLWVLLVFVTGILLRVEYTLHVQPPESFVISDMRIYVDLARRFAQSNGPAHPWDVTHPMGYPALLSFLMSSDGALTRAVIAQIIVSSLVPLAVGLLGAAAFGRRTGLLAIVFASVYYPFINYGALFLAEVHFIFWLALAFAGLLGAITARRRAASLALAAAGGVALSIATVLKAVALPAALALFAVEGAALLLARPPGPSSWRGRLKPWFLRGLIVAVAAAPVLGAVGWVCTRANGGRFCVTGNKAGADFLLGHNGRVAAIEWAPDQGHGFEFGSPGSFLRHYDARAKVPFTMTDSAANAAAAWRWIFAHPGEAIVLSLDHVYDTFFGVAAWPGYGHPTWPFDHFSQYVFFVFLFVPTLLAGRRVLKRGARAALTSRTALVIAPILALAVTVAIATGEVRYRIPFDVFFAAIACAFFVGDFARVDGVQPDARR